MVALGAILAGLLTAINIWLALRATWKDWKQRKEKPHPLEASLQDIAAAIRARDRRLQDLDAQIKATDDARRRFQWRKG